MPRIRIEKAAKTGWTFRYDGLGLTLLLFETIKTEAIEMRDADPTAVGFRRPAAHADRALRVTR
jgi:hypothetical protein